MRKHLYVDSVDLATYGVYISGQGTFGAGEREYTFYDVPSRDGALVGAQTRLANVSVSYDCFIYTNFETNIRNLRSFLLSRVGYVKINDDYDTTHYRMAVYEGPFEPTVTTKNDAGQFTLTFNCQPQRWLTSGNTTVTINAGDGAFAVIGTNPSPFKSKPIIEVYGSGFFTLNNVKVTVDAISGASSVVIDCDTMACTYLDGYGFKYDASYAVGFADYLSGVNDVDAPVLKSGQNKIDASNYAFTVTKIVITPRWWEV